MKLSAYSTTIRQIRYKADEPSSQALRWGEIRLHSRQQRVCRGGKHVLLTPKEYEVVELFMLNPSQIFSKDDLLARCWGIGFAISSGTGVVASTKVVDVYVQNICVKLGDKIIKAVSDSEYRLAPASS